MNAGEEGVLKRSSVLLRVMLFAVAASVAFGEVIVTPSVTFDGSLCTCDYQLGKTELPAAIDFRLTISALTTGIFALNEDWIAATFPVGSETGLQWITKGLGIQPGEALSGFRMISSDAAGPATFRIDFDDFEASIPGSTQEPSGVPRPAGAALAGLGVLSLQAARCRLRYRGEA